MIKGFRDFILRGNVMDLAVAVIIGTAFTVIVTSLTANIINPLLGAVVGKPNFDYLVGHINGGEIKYGTFITAVINFLLIAAVVYFFLVLPAQYLLKRYNPPNRLQPRLARSAWAISRWPPLVASFVPSLWHSASQRRRV
jgi:large conductance mechanosensitive channel